MKKAASFIILIINVVLLFGQEDSTCFSIDPQVDLMSRYIWRGTDYGSSPSMQPSCKIQYKSFTFGMWGAYTVSKDSIQEADLFMSYDVIKDRLTLMITDYFFPNEHSFAENYFEYNVTLTSHVLEGTVLWKPSKKMPLTLLTAINFHGADARYLKNDGRLGEIMYSTYSELTYSFKNLDIFAGYSFMDPDEQKGEAGYYGFASGFVNLGMKAQKVIPVNDKYKIPVSVSLIFNPQKEKIYLVAGITI